MSSLRSLAGQTAIYGLSSIIGRLAYFLLTPLHTYVLSKGQMGINTDIYSWIAVLTVVLTLGLETTYFRFSTRRDVSEKAIFRQTYLILLSGVLIFNILVLLLQSYILKTMRYTAHPEYLWLLMVILSGEVLATLPYARLRQQGKAMKFALIRLTNICINIGLNLYFFLLVPYTMERGLYLPAPVNPVLGIFLANAAAVVVQLLLLAPLLKPIYTTQEPAYPLRKILRYGLPVMLAGLPGIINEVFDRQLLKYLLPPATSLEELGVYAAVFRLSVFISLFIQAFRYAAEPFFFKNADNIHAPALYARVMDVFVVLMALAVVVLSLFLPLIKYFIHNKFWEGLYILPILFSAQMLLGIIFNLNIWYKVTEKTEYGILISGTGAFANLTLNISLIPSFGILGASLALLVSHATMTLVSYHLSRKHYPIPYPVSRMSANILLATAASFVLCLSSHHWLRILVFFTTLLMLASINKQQLIPFLKQLKTKWNR